MFSKRKAPKNTYQQTALSRRAFLGSAATIAAGAAVLTVGCSPKTASTDSAAGTGEADGAGAVGSVDAVAIRQAPAKLNPQDYDFTSNASDLATLFSPWQLGPLTLSHRMVKSSASTENYMNGLEDGLKELIGYYANFAKGGVEMVWVENFAAFLKGCATMRGVDFSEYPMDKLVEAIHSEGSYLGYQWDTMGVTIADIPFTVNADGSFTMANINNVTIEQIKELQGLVIEGAVRLKQYGFDAFEINCAGINFPATALSRLLNQRTDEYGAQTFESRTRFVVELIKGIKDACGKDFIVQVLINGIEENDVNIGDSASCTTIAENIEMMKLIEAAGADSLEVRLGPPGQHVAQFASELYFTGYGIDGATSYGTQFDFTRHWEGKLVANHSGCGLMLDVAKEFKRVLAIPVGAVTYMDPAIAPDLFEQALKNGDVDFLVMNRPLIVEKDYVKKLKEGRIDEIAPCCRCLHCFCDTENLETVPDYYQTATPCRVNACTARAFREEMPEGYDVPAGGGNKSVMVIGAGPAGMEAARIAAARGYAVTLYEKKDSVGGLLEFASLVKGPHENLNKLRSYLEHQLEVTGVTLVTGKEVDAAFVKEQAPDVVIVATGGIRAIQELRGSASIAVVPIAEFMGAEIGEKVTIIGANVQAVDTALYLLAQGKQITMVFPDAADQLSKGQSHYVKAFTQPALFSRGMRVWPQAEITSVGDGEITVKVAAGTSQTLLCDTIIDATDMLPDDDLASQLSGIETHVVGDCQKPWSIAYAISHANLLARRI
jgi:2,4-dienoyl-CoA reductase-like NADH-dependent reductase (Old Yellow Enzyme family)/thioredoxin reductase